MTLAFTLMKEVFGQIMFAIAIKPVGLRCVCIACLVAVCTALLCGLAMTQYTSVKLQLRDDSQNVRVLCWIMTQPQNYASKAMMVNATWAPRCDGYFFLSSASDIKPPLGLPIVAMKLMENHDNLWEKTQAAFLHIYSKYLNDYDFFLKADDDSYIVLENLRRFLSRTKPTKPVFAGRRFRPYTKRGYMSGGGGYVLSRAAVQALVEKAFKLNNTLCQKHDGAEDVNMGVCLENVGVEVLDSIDEYGRERFHPFDLATHINLPKNSWLWKYNYHPIKKLLSGVSAD